MPLYSSTMIIFFRKVLHSEVHLNISPCNISFYETSYILQILSPYINLSFYTKNNHPGLHVFNTIMHLEILLSYQNLIFHILFLIYLSIKVWGFLCPKFFLHGSLYTLPLMMISSGCTFR